MADPLTVSPATDASTGAARARSRRTSLLSWTLLVVGTCGFAAIWVMLSLSTGRQNGWMAVLGALDVTLMLHLGGWRRGWTRAATAMVATAAAIAVANWGIIAAQLGAMLGRTPWDSAMRLGLHHAWTLAQLVNGTAELLWIAVAAVVAIAFSR